MKKRILISVYDMEIGGIERSLITMLEHFDYERYEVDLLVFSHQGDLLGQLPPSVNLLPERGSYTVFRKPMKQCLKEGRIASVAVRLLVKLIADAKARSLKLSEGSGYIQLQLVSNYMSSLLPSIDKRYDAVISYAWPHDFMLKRVKADKRLAWIHTDYTKLQIDHTVDEAMWASYDGIASISEACTEAFLSRYPALSGRLFIVENIASPAYIRSKALEDEAEGMDNGSFNLVSVGRLSYVKGFDMAIEAIRLLEAKGLHKVKWHIVGFGGTEGELRAKIVEYGLEERVILHGKKQNPYPYMKACDLYVQPSRYEGKAVTVTEAQIVGKPVLITNYPTSGSQVRDGVDGLICETNAEAIAGAIERLYRDDSLRERLITAVKGMDYGNAGELAKLYGWIEGVSAEREEENHAYKQRVGRAAQG
ncbi:glycosyltransferase [Paenibacillus sp. 1011MAR3C5]|uniref:glycosyltransferase n=1 Tax=Paenibacillus sp. 1011MAR3C5 TaxID=1675787 RepID=UPI000E6B8AD4|nr:glycosyltransferase [Paenibacillus sp. 1011MAR3C5]RJE91152.1 glycosyltransferase [Paenibacillus sp. 1011MAR3C5]